MPERGQIGSLEEVREEPDELRLLLGRPLLPVSSQHLSRHLVEVEQRFRHQSQLAALGARGGAGSLRLGEREHTGHGGLDELERREGAGRWLSLAALPSALGQRGLTAAYERNPERREDTEPTQ